MKIFLRCLLFIPLLITIFQIDANAKTSLKDIKYYAQRGSLPYAQGKLGMRYQDIRMKELGGDLDTTHSWYVYANSISEVDLNDYWKLSYWFYFDYANKPYFSEYNQRVLVMKEEFNSKWSQKQLKEVFGNPKKIQYTTVYTVGQYYLQFDKLDSTTVVSIVKKKHFKKYQFGS